MFKSHCHYSKHFLTCQHTSFMNKCFHFIMTGYFPSGSKLFYHLLFSLPSSIFHFPISTTDTINRGSLRAVVATLWHTCHGRLFVSLKAIIFLRIEMLRKTRDVRETGHRKKRILSSRLSASV